MPWLRVGDNISTHPIIFRLIEVCEGDLALRNEAWGALVLVASISAQHCTDYVVAPGMVSMMAPGRASVLIDIWVKAGLASHVQIDGRPMIQIHEDEDLLHMRLKEEVTIDRLRKADGRRPDLMIPVRVRDGDQCRWCGKSVKWGDQKSGRGATIDSLTGHVDSTVDTLVVACRDCNTKRGNGIELTLRPAPSPQEVYYSDKTIAYVNESEWARESGITLLPKQLRLDLAQAATDGEEGSGKAAAPVAAPDTASVQAAARVAAPTDSPDKPDGTAPGTNGLDDAPDWVVAPLSEVQAAARVAAPDTASVQAAAPVAAPDLFTSKAATDGEEGSGKAAAPVAAPDTASVQAAARVAAPTDSPDTPDGTAPVSDNHIQPELTRDLDQRGDGSGFVGSGRDGSGRAGPGRARTDLGSSGSFGWKKKKRGRRGRRK